MKTYQEKIKELQEELRAIADEQALGVEARKGVLAARAASARRSLRWYEKRLPRRLGTLSVRAHEEIALAERV